MIATQYTDVTVVSTAANGYDMSFSSDTGIAECLVIGRRRQLGEDASRRGTFISLRRRPGSFVEAQEFSKAVLSSTTVRRLEDGPYGGVPVYSGDALAAELLNAPVDSHENGWGAARILDASVAQIAHSLSHGKLWLPAEPDARELPMAQLKQVGQRGLDSQLLVSAAHKGPFAKLPPSPTATYPSLWSHNARNEMRMACAPDSQLQVRQGMEDRAAEVWSTASRAHVSRGFRFNSQSLAVALTDQLSIGGRAWPNVKFEVDQFDYAFAVWGNSTLGLLCYWWHSTRQQSGRGDITIRSAESLPMLDFRELNDDQLLMAELIFDEFRDKDLKPAYLADADPKRALLDRRVVCDLLGFDDAVYDAVRRLAAKWCAERSVHGGKLRPEGVSLIM